MSKRKDPNRYPPNLDAKKIADIIAYYDARNEVDLMEDENHEFLYEPTSWVEVPLELLPQVRKLISKHRKSA